MKLLAICSFCKKVRDLEKDSFVQKNWRKATQIELQSKDLSHGFCPSCGKKHYPEFLNKEACMTGIKRVKRNKRNSTRLSYSRFKQITQNRIVQFVQSLDIKCVITAHGITFGSIGEKDAVEKKLQKLIKQEQK